MTLTLHILSSGAQAGRETQFSLIGGALSIGRAESNNVVLPDPTREVSSSHAVVQERGGDYVIVDTSTNGTFLNGERDPLGDFPTPLNDGDTLRIGPYELRVSIAVVAGRSDQFADLPPPEGETPIVFDTAPPTLDTLGEIGGLDMDGGDFLEGLMVDAPPNAMRARSRDVVEDVDSTIDDFLDIAPDKNLMGGASAPDHSAPGQDFFQTNQSRSAIPDEWEDDFLSGMAPPAPASPTPGKPTAAPAAGLIPETTFSPEPIKVRQPESIAAPIPQPEISVAKTPASETLQDASGIDDLDDFLTGPLTEPDPLANLVLDPAPGESIPAPAIAQPAPVVAQPAAVVAPVLAPVSAPVSAPVAPTPAASAAPTTGGGADLARQFLTAAGVDHRRIADDELGEIMERAGTAYRTLIEGAREVLMARASIKDELRLGQTMISPDGNNPIKFSISGQQAIEAMIKPTVAGYQTADKAAREAMYDIKAHEVAMMSGMESAIKTLLGRFDPANLASKIENSGRIAGFLKGKKAQYWDIFEKLYAKLSEEAEEDFNALFGKEFSKAYKDQLNKLKSK
jgi:type VI secretion system protein